VIERATRAFDAFDYAQALSITEDFFWPVFCDNYLELAKPRTYEEALTAGRLSACATLRLTLRVLVRMFAPFVPYICEEIWQWHFVGDPDMHTSIHRSPWPTLEAIAAVPEPAHTAAWPAAIRIVEHVRRAKADANLSMAAPGKQVSVVCTPTWEKAVGAVADDVQRTLRIASWSAVPGTPQEGDIDVETILE